MQNLTAEDWSGVRGRIVAIAVGLCFLAITSKATFVALGADPVEAGTHQRIETASRRADIVDRNGDLLATSLTIDSLAADPSRIWDAADVAAGIVSVFPDLDAARLTARLSDSSRKFVWIRRKVSPRQRQALFELGLEGLRFEKEVQRIYTGGELAGHLVGFTNVDAMGISGLEYIHDERLKAGGEALALTIDSGVQFALEDELRFAAEAFDVIGAAGVMIEAKTGAVRAIASWPAIDPNRPGDFSESARLNRAVGAVYELGSVFKPLTAAAGFEVGELRPSEVVDVSRPILFGAEKIVDRHPISARATITDIIAHSSNVGTVRIAERVGARRLRAFFGELGLLARPDVAFPGVARPIEPDHWSPLSTATISYGHGVAVSPLALAAAYTAFANEGEVVRPRFVEPGPHDVVERRRVMSAPTSAIVLQMMRAVVTEGTGKRAEVFGYEIAGKTGTAEKPTPDGYDKTRNVNSFVALFPASRPEYVVLIVLDEPKARPGEGATASYNAAPIAGRFIARVAPMLDVAPVLVQPEEEIQHSPGVRAVSDKRAL